MQTAEIVIYFQFSQQMQNLRERKNCSYKKLSYHRPPTAKRFDLCMECKLTEIHSLNKKKCALTKMNPTDKRKSAE